MLNTRRQTVLTDLVHIFHIINNIIFNCLPTDCLCQYLLT